MSNHTHHTATESNWQTHVIVVDICDAPGTYPVNSQTVGHKSAAIELYNKTHTDKNPWLGFVVFKLSHDATVSIVDAFDKFAIPLDSESLQVIEDAIKIHLTRKGFHA